VSTNHRTITVLKLNTENQVTWRYQGQVIDEQPDHLTLEAYFDRDDVEFHGIWLRKGDRFVETYFTNRWYNIFEIHARDDDTLRGWYCNVGSPAQIEGATLSYIDLALDLLVYPDHRQVVLDEDEFEHLDISPQVKQQAIDALAALQEQFK
jgi:hypothetical protein